MRCIVIVPFLNEAAHLGTFLASVAGQSRRPDQLVLVDDGSTDASPQMADAFAAEHTWATVLRRPPRPPGKDRLAGAPELAAFLWAAERVRGDNDVVVKMDADLALGADTFAAVLRGFEEDERLGIAGVYLTVRGPNGRSYQERHPREHVRGGTRFYRRACFEAVAPIPVMLGWDGADEVRARARGWRTRSFVPDEPVIHLRPTGLQDGRLRARVRWGMCAYAVGAHPLGVLGAAAHQVYRRPWVIGGMAFVWGWLDARRQGVPRAPVDIRRAKQAEQRRRAEEVVRRRIPWLRRPL